MNRHVVPASVLQNLIELSLRSRLVLEDIFREAGIDPDVVGRPDALIPVEQLDRLFSIAFARVEDPWFGLHAGLSNQYTSLDLVGRLMATSATLRAAIHELMRFKDLLAPYLQFSLTEEQGVAILSCGSDGSVRFTESHHHNDLVVATMVVIGCALAGGDMGVRALVFCHPEPPDISEYRRAFGDVALHFGALRNEVHFDVLKLDCRLNTAYPRYRERVEKLAEQQLSRLVRGETMREQVVAQLEQRLGEATVTIEDIAHGFNMTSRTLQRRLRAEAITFGELRDGVRHAAACRLLAQPGMDMDTLAQRLGFSDTANFYHAFRRWEGRTPGDYRRSVRAAD